MSGFIGIPADDTVIEAKTMAFEDYENSPLGIGLSSEEWLIAYATRERHEGMRIRAFVVDDRLWKSVLRDMGPRVVYASSGSVISYYNRGTIVVRREGT